MRFRDLRGRRVVVWGTGREGSAVADHCEALGIAVTVVEPDIASGNSPSVLYGDAARAAVLDAEVVVKSPGVPVTAPLVVEALERGVELTSLTDLWLTENADRAVAVTGSKGKSTTSALLDHILRHAGVSSSLRGNIGTSVLTETDPPSDVVVVEVSSYQAQSVTLSPRLVVVTSLFPEHLTWHGSAQAYFADKLNLVAHQCEVVVVPGDNPLVIDQVSARVAGSTRVVATGPTSVSVGSDGGIEWADGTRVSPADLPLAGRHQAGNIALAALAAAQLGVPAATSAEAIASFVPLPHRMERVPSTDDRVWIDDSLATAPEAVVASLSSMPPGHVALVVGGADRGLDFAPLVAHLGERDDVTLLLIGPTGRRINGSTGLGTVFASFAAAMDWAGSPANPAPTVLLSPGAPSHDEFADYEERAAAFRAAAGRASS